MPFTLQFTPVKAPPAPLTFAVNVCVPPVERVAVAGSTFTEILSCSVTATELLARGSAALTAVTATLGGDGKITGAVYIPDELIVPAFALPPGTPFTCHDTLVFELPVTLAWNCCVCPNESVMLDGETVTTTEGGGGGGGDPPEVLPQLANKIGNPLKRIPNKMFARACAEKKLFATRFAHPRNCSREKLDCFAMHARDARCVPPRRSPPLDCNARLKYVKSSERPLQS